MTLRAIGLVVMLVGVVVLFASTRSGVSDQSLHAEVKRYDHSGIGGATAPPWTSYDSLVVAHGVMMFVAWQILAPLAIMIASMCRTWSRWWLRAHWIIQGLIVLPLTVTAVIIGAVMHTQSGKPITKHKILGVTIFTLMLLQAVIGVATRAERKEKVTSGKRSTLAWTHIAIGLVLVTISGLNISWGFQEYTRRPVPTWIRIAHYCIAGVPLVILGPFVLIRGLLRMRRGMTFVEAFFDRPETAVTRPPTQPPRVLFDWDNSSAYIEQRASELGPRQGAEDGEGYSYVGSSIRSLLGPRASIKSYSSTSTWEGAATREEYEISLLERGEPGLVPYDYPEAVFGGDQPDMTRAALLQTSHDDGDTAAPPLPPYPADLRRTDTERHSISPQHDDSDATALSPDPLRDQPVRIDSPGPPLLPPIPPSFSTSRTVNTPDDAQRPGLEHRRAVPVHQATIASALTTQSATRSGTNVAADQDDEQMDLSRAVSMSATMLNAGEADDRPCRQESSVVGSGSTGKKRLGAVPEEGIDMSEAGKHDCEQKVAVEGEHDVEAKEVEDQQHQQQERASGQGQEGAEVAEIQQQEDRQAGEDGTRLESEIESLLSRVGSGKWMGSAESK